MITYSKVSGQRPSSSAHSTSSWLPSGRYGPSILRLCKRKSRKQFKFERELDEAEVPDEQDHHYEGGGQTDTNCCQVFIQSVLSCCSKKQEFGEGPPKMPVDQQPDYQKVDLESNREKQATARGAGIQVEMPKIKLNAPIRDKKGTQQEAREKAKEVPKENMQTVVSSHSTVRVNEQVQSLNRNMSSEIKVSDVYVESVEKRIQDLGIEIDADNKEKLQKLKCNLISLIVVVNDLKKKLVKAKDQNVILAVGSTGCGKSTMLNALIWGPESLEAKKVEQTIELKNGKQKQIQRVVIESKKPQAEFKIGHSSSKSETFLPHFYKMDKIGSMFVDLAGLEDTGGQFISLINCFVSKFIFDYACNVRFLIPLTREATQNARGSQIKELLRTVQNICSKDLDDVVQAIQPVITRVKPGDGEESDVYALRQTVSNHLETELEAWANQHADKNNEKDKQLIEQQRQLYENFAEKMELYDPLDRPLPTAEDPQSITTEELLSRITELKPIEGYHLNAPIPYKSMSQLDQMFRVEFDACDMLAEEYIQEAKDQGTEFSRIYQDEKVVKDFQLVLDFFAENSLLADAARKRREFRDYVFGDSGILELISDATQFSGYNKASQQLFELMQGVFKCRRNHEDLVKAVIKLLDCIESKKNGEKMDDLEEQSAVDHMLSKASRQLEQIVLDLNQDSQQLIKFCYYLRKLDVENKYSFNLLNGYVRPPILVDIICANHWDEKLGQMQSDTAFNIHIGNDNKSFQYNAEGGPPFILKEMLYNSKVWFKLEEGGFLISNGKHHLASFDAEIAQGSQSLITFRNNPVKDGKSEKHYLWNLISSASLTDSLDYPQFHIQMTYGDVKPRIIYSGSSILRQGFVASTRFQHKDYSSQETSVWKIYKSSQ